MEKDLEKDQLKINVNLKETTPLVCEKCKGEVFGEGLYIRKLSRFVTGSPQDSLIPIAIFYCVRCQHVNDDLLPAALKSTK